MKRIRTGYMNIAFANAVMLAFFVWFNIDAGLGGRSFLNYLLIAGIAFTSLLAIYASLRALRVIKKPVDTLTDLFLYIIEKEHSLLTLRMMEKNGREYPYLSTQRLDQVYSFEQLGFVKSIDDIGSVKAKVVKLGFVNNCLVRQLYSTKANIK